MHCSRVFRSSAPSDLLPSSPGGRPSGTAPGECGSTRSTEMGGRPRWRSVTTRVMSGRDIARRAHRRRHVAGAGPLSGEGRATPRRLGTSPSSSTAMNAHSTGRLRSSQRSCNRRRSGRSRISRATSVRPASVGQAGRAGAGRHRRIPGLSAAWRAGSPGPRPPVAGSGPGHGRRTGRLDLG